MPLTEKRAREALEKMRHKYRQAREAWELRRRDRELESALFTQGLQHEEIVANEKEIAADEAVETANMIRPLVRAATAATFRAIPTIEVATTHDDPAGHTRAELVERAARSAFLNGIVDWDEFHRCIAWSKQGGLGWMEILFNPDAGREIVSEESLFEEEDDFEAKDEEADLFGERVRRSMREGEIETVFVATAEGFQNPDARTKKEIRQFFRTRLYAEDRAKELFSKDYFGKKIEAFDGGRDTMAADDWRMSQMQDYGEQEESLVEVVEAWYLPTGPAGPYPNGAYALFSGATLIYMGPNWLAPKRLPFVPFFGDCIVTGSLHPDGMVEDLKGIQQTHNFLLSKMKEHADKVLNPTRLVPVQSGVDASAFTNKAGQTLRYLAGHPPSFDRPPGIDQSMFQFLEYLKAQANLISGYHDFTRGNLGTNVSGRSMILARENEGLTREPDNVSFQISCLEMVQHIIHLMRQFYPDGRMFRVLGSDGRWEKAEFMAEDFDVAQDLIIQVNTGSPTTPGAQFTEILELLQYGALDDTPQAERARDMLASKYYKKSTFDVASGDRAKARRENLIIQHQWPDELAVATFDNHAVHLGEHNQFRKTTAYEQLPPDLRMKLDAHCDEHEDLQEAQMIDLQGLQSGGPGAGPPGTVPGEGNPSGAAPDNAMLTAGGQGPDALAEGTDFLAAEQPANGV